MSVVLLKFTPERLTNRENTAEGKRLTRRTGSLSMRSRILAEAEDILKS